VRAYASRNSQRVPVDLQLAGEGELLFDVTAVAVLSSTTEAHAAVLAVMRSDSSDSWLELALDVELEAERTYAH